MIKNLFIILLVTSLYSCKRSTSETNINGSRNVITNTTNQNRVNNRTRIAPDNNVVKMTLYGGVYTIPIEINDTNMNIIFDTGASSISISEAEVIFLIKQNKITEEDFLGSVHFQDATGNISEGTRINLKKIKIGNKEIYNVEASVVHNLEAPLLLGQSALSQFGKLTIDYNKNEIIFE